MPAKAPLFLFVGPTSLLNDFGSTLARLVPSKSAVMIVRCDLAVAAVGAGAAWATSVVAEEANTAVAAMITVASVRLVRVRACVITASTFRGSPSWVGRARRTGLSLVGPRTVSLHPPRPVRRSPETSQGLIR